MWGELVSHQLLASLNCRHADSPFHVCGLLSASVLGSCQLCPGVLRRMSLLAYCLSVHTGTDRNTILTSGTFISICAGKLAIAPPLGGRTSPLACWMLMYADTHPTLILGTFICIHVGKLPVMPRLGEKNLFFGMLCTHAHTLF